MLVTTSWADLDAEISPYTKNYSSPEVTCDVSLSLKGADQPADACSAVKKWKNVCCMVYISATESDSAREYMSVGWK